MRGTVYCPDDELPGFDPGGLIVCSASSTPQFVLDTPGLSDLAWDDVLLLMGALLTAVALAAAYNTISKLFWGGR